MNRVNRWPVRIAVGIMAGLAIAAVDNFAFQGEISPIVIVILLLATTAMAGAIWGWHGWVTAIAAWACIPLAHVLKRVLGLPDTLQPNTFASILMLAGFSLVVAAIGFGCGVLIHGLTTDANKRR
jgi:hypothetical protein